MASISDTKAEKTSFWKWFSKRYLIDGLNGMALGLFSTLIVGLIIKQIGSIVGDNQIGYYIVQLGTFATVVTGVGIGVGAAHMLNSPKLIIYASVVTGFIGANAAGLVNGTLIVDGAIALKGAGDPLGAFLAAVAGVEVARLIAGKTKVDIILTPLVTIFAGGVVGIIIGPPLAGGMKWLGEMITLATLAQPFIMGIVLSVVMGMILTLPISSAALSIILGLSNLPAGAATVGCSAQMIGFAVASFRENKFDGLIAQGLGTSMLQVPNIVKNPYIWIPPTLASAILGPVSTMLFKMENNPAGGGMGTSGLVGQIMTWQTMTAYESGATVLVKIIILHFILPAVLTLIFSEYMRKKGLIKFGDMKLTV